MPEENSMSGYQTFVVPYDFSEHARAALDVAADLAGRLGADLHLVHVLEVPVLYTYGLGTPPAPPIIPPYDISEFRKGAMESLQQIAADADAPGVIKPHVVEGANVAEAIRVSAEDLAADLIIMGTRGRTGLAHVILGSVTERTLRSAACPVLTVRAKKEEAAD
jgi:universal stress protein A